MSQLQTLKKLIENKSLFHNSPIAQIITDDTGIIILANQLSAVLFRKDLTEIENKKISNFINFNKEFNYKNIKYLNDNVVLTTFNIPVKIKLSVNKYDGDILIHIYLINYLQEKIKEDFIENLQKKLEILNTTAQNFLTFDYNENIFKYIGKAIREMVPRAIIFVSYYDSNEDVFIIKSISGINKKIKILSDKIGIDLIGHKIKVDKLPNRKNDKLINIDEIKNYDFVSILSIGKVYETARNLFMINNHYSILLKNKNELLGNISIFTRGEKKIENPELIELFANQAGAAIQKYNLQEKFIEAKEKAEESDKLKSAFLANMSHEIRTPINTIIGFSELLAQEEISTEQRIRYYNMIKGSSDNLLNLINDILDISQIESGHLKIINTNFNLYEVIKDILPVFRKKLKDEKLKVNIIYKVPKDLKTINISTDKFRLKQIVSNLINNAIKFTTKGKIEVGYTKEGNFIQIYVKDTGKGISKKAQKNIFDRFFQDSKIQKGTGLGLAISKQLSQLMGGDLFFNSTIHKGSNFYFHIPIKENIQIKQHVKKDETTLKDWKGKSILIVEDEDLNYELLYEILINTNANITRVNNGKKAVDYCKENTPDVILMDIKMPVMDGYTASSKILEIKPKIKIIAQTAFAMVGEKEKAINIGCVDFISKPIKKDILIYKINKFI